MSKLLGAVSETTWSVAGDRDRSREGTIRKTAELLLSRLLRLDSRFPLDRLLSTKSDGDLMIARTVATPYVEETVRLLSALQGKAPGDTID